MFSFEEIIQGDLKMYPVTVIKNEVSVRDAIEDEQSHFQSICLSSKVDGFTCGENVGNTLYNLYRSSSVRKAELPGSIWHWVTVKGKYYMGLIMVDSPEGVERVTVKVREKVIGEIVADKCDNRRHLYVFSELFDFEFAETLEFITPADDLPYVIEGVLYTPDFPVEKEIKLEADEKVLLSEDFSIASLDEFTVANPKRIRAERYLFTGSMELPGATNDSFQLRNSEGALMPFELLPLTETDNGNPVLQQLKILMALSGKTEETFNFEEKTEETPSGCDLLKITEQDSHKLVLANGRKEAGISVCGDSLKVESILDKAFTLCPELTALDGSKIEGIFCNFEIVEDGLLEKKVDFFWKLKSNDFVLDITVELMFDVELSDVKIEHSFVVCADEKFVEFKELALAFKVEAEGADCFVKSDSETFMGKCLKVTANDWRIIGVDTSKEKSSVQTLTAIGTGDFTLVPMEFAELYPSVISAADGDVKYKFLPESFVVPENLTEELKDRLFFYVTENGYKLHKGVMRRHRFMICGAGESLEGKTALYREPLCLSKTRYYQNGRFEIADDALLNANDVFAEKTLEAWKIQQEQLGAFGIFNYGDWFGERKENWGNGEYDTSYGLLMQAVLSGLPEYRKLALASARHLLEVDTIHDANDKYYGWQIMHCMGHVGDYFPEGYRVGSYGPRGGIGVAHNWLEGVLLYYQISGDKLALKCATKMLDELSSTYLGTKYFSNGRDVGWHLIHLTAGASVLRRKKYLDAASRLVSMALERQRQDGSWRRVLKSDHCRCYPFHTGNTGFMIGVLLQGFMKYHLLTGSKEVEDGLLRGCRFLIRDMYDEESNHFHYTSCPDSKMVKGSTAGIICAMVYSLTLPGATEEERELYLKIYNTMMDEYYQELTTDPTPQRLKDARAKDISKFLRTVPHVLNVLKS
jgi:hypothetical protein